MLRIIYLLLIFLITYSKINGQVLNDNSIQNVENKKEISSFSFEDGTKLSYDKQNNHLKVDVVEKLTLKVGEAKIEMTKNGIKLKGKRIDLN